MVVGTAITEQRLGIDLRNQVKGIFRQREETILNFLHNALGSFTLGGIGFTDGILLVLLPEDRGNSGL